MDQSYVPTILLITRPRAYHWESPKMQSSPPPRCRGPSRLDHNVKEIGSGARTQKNNLQAVHLLRVMIDKPTLYDQLIIGKMLQSDLPPPYTQ